MSVSSDNVGVTAYQVYRGTTLVGTVAGTSFTDTGLIPNMNYTYKFYAKDAAANISIPSSPVTVTTSSMPSIEAVSISTTTITWKVVFPASGAVDNKLQIQKVGTGTWTDVAGASSLTNGSYASTALLTNTSYIGKISWKVSGNPFSAQITIKTDDYVNGTSGATVLTVGTPVSANIDYAADVDYFSFTPTASGDYTINTTGSTDTYGELFTSSGENIGYDDAGTDGCNFSITQSLLKNNTYNIKVRHYSTSSSSGSYNIVVAAEFAITDDCSDVYTSALLLTVGTAVNKNINYPGDIDWFKFTLGSSDGGDYIIQSTGETDVRAELYNSSMTMLGEGDDSYSDLNFNFTNTLAGNQTYYIKVFHYDETEGTGLYGVNVTKKLVTPDDVGNNSASATLITVGNSAFKQIDYGGDEDWFKFTTSQNGVYTIKTTGSSDTYGELYNSGLSMLDFCDDSDSDYNFKIQQYLTTGQTYYIKVRHYDTVFGTGAYTVSVVLESGITDSDSNLYSSATQISLNTTVSGKRIDYTGDVDWFKFTATVGGTYFIASTGATDTYGELYDSSGNNLLGSNDDYNDQVDLNFGISKVLTAGQVYYVKVRHYSTGTGDYGIRVTSP